MLQRFFTDLLHEDLGLATVEFRFDTLATDRLLMANVLKQAGPERFTVNESREMLGQPEAEGPLVDALWTATPAGVPLVLGYPKGKTPADTGAPVVPPEEAPAPAAETPPPPETLQKADADLRRWRKQALKFHREGHLEKALTFTSDAIPAGQRGQIAEALEKATTAEDVRAAFELQAAPETTAARLAGDLEALLHGVREERGRRSGW
jgi:hypothetical protein